MRPGLSRLRFRIGSLAVPAYTAGMVSRLAVFLLTGGLFGSTAFAAEKATPSAAGAPAPRLAFAVFDIDATPPIGSLMAYAPGTKKWDLGWRARGIVLLGAAHPAGPW